MAGLFAVNLYRARTQSITCDEAFTHNLFLAGPVGDMFRIYDANHHVLHTLLAKASVTMFGLSEFTLRLPALLGGLLYLLAAYRLSRYVLGEGWMFLLGLGALTLNPFVLDFLSAARGYGLALAFFFWGLYWVARRLAGDGTPALLYPAGLALGLAVAANLTLLFPAVALAAVVAALLIGAGPGSSGERFWRAVDGFLGPALVIAFVILAVPLSHAGRDQFYVGTPHLKDTLESLVAYSLFHHGEIGLIREHWLFQAAKIAVPAVLLLGGAAVAAALYLWWRGRDWSAVGRKDRFLALLGATALLTLALNVAAHRLLGFRYPEGRTGLYWIPIITLLAAALAHRLAGLGVAGWVAAAPVAVFLALCIFQFGRQFNTRYYAEWPFDAASRQIISTIRAHHERHPKEKAQVGATWLFEPSLNFYRQMYRLGWMAPVDRAKPDGDFNYYVLLPPDTVLIEKRGLRLLLHDAFSQAAVAVPRQ